MILLNIFLIIQVIFLKLIFLNKKIKGGHRALLKFAGKDGTENVQFHSSKMMKLLNNYFYIGKLYQENNNKCSIM